MIKPEEFPDYVTREEIRSDFKKNLLIEASAGTGKTAMLIERLTNALLDEGLDIAPSNIVAITFTNPAAAELRRRVREKIRSLQPEHPEKAAAILEGLDSMAVMTIHAFCNRLISQYPVEADTDSDTEALELEELDSAGLWENFVAEKIFNGTIPAEKVFLVETLGVDMMSVWEFIKTHLRYPDLTIWTPEGPKDSRQLVEETIRLFEDYMKWINPHEIKENCIDKDKDALYGYLVSLPVNYSKLSDKDEKFLFALNARNIPGTPAANWEKSGRKSFATIYTGEASGHIQVINKLLVGYITNKCAEIMAEFGEYFHSFKISKGIITHEDSLMKARHLLSGYPDIRERLQSIYKMVFVDEFQDTDPIQAEIITWLCSEKAAKEKDWRKVKLKKGSLTVVGDPKQSIYRFRRADIRTYKKFGEKFDDDEKKLLLTNFRSDVSVIEAVNHHFEKVMTDEKDGGCKYEKLFSSTEAQGIVTTHLLNIKLEEDGEYPERFSGGKINGKMLVDIGRPREAALIAAKVKELVKKGIRIFDRKKEEERILEYSDFMVLFRVNTNVDLWVRAFEKEGVPVEAIAGSGFFKKPEVREALQVFRAFAVPGDSVSVYGALKSPFFSLSDSDIHHYVKLNNKKLKYLYSELPAGGRTKEVIEEMQSIFQDLQSIPERARASYVCRRCGMLELYGSVLHDTPATLSIRKLISLLENMCDENGWSMVRSLREINKLAEEKDDRAMSLKSDKAAGVRLLTMHKAKGLEAPVVIMGDVIGSNLTHADSFIDRETNTFFSKIKIESNVTSSYTAEHPDWEEVYKKNARKMSLNEELRLQYVALTRAMNILFIPYTEDAASKPWSDIAKSLGPLDCVDETASQFAGEGSLVDYPSIEGVPDNEKAENIRTGFKNFLQEFTLAYYKKIKPSELEDDPEFHHKEGYGKEHGSIVHELLKNLIREPDMPIDWEGYENKDIIKKHIDNAVNSDIWKRAMAVEEKYGEFSIGRYDKEKKEMVQGVIDLVFKEDDGWVIVDYKTNKIENEEQLKELTEHYKLQMGEYKKSFEEITGEKIKETKLLFLDL